MYCPTLRQDHPGLTGQYFGRTWGILRTGPTCRQDPEPKGYLQPLTHIQGEALGTAGRNGWDIPEKSSLMDKVTPHTDK